MSTDVVDEVFEQYKNQANQDIASVPEPARTLISLYTAQGIIGNGGFKMLFESDFIDVTGFETIIKSYRNVGLENHAREIEGLIKIFPDFFLHISANERHTYLVQYYTEQATEYLSLEKADNFFYEDYESPYEIAKNYYEKHSV